MEILKNPNFDFLGRARYFFVVSVLLVAAGLYAIAGGHLRYGVEFSGGTQLILQFQSSARDRQDPRRGRDGLAGLGDPDLRRAGGQQGPRPPRPRGATTPTSTPPPAPPCAALADSYADNPVIESSSEIVGPIVGGELRRKAVLLVSLGLLFQLVYLAVRFKGGIWGLAAAVAALHDVLVALGHPEPSSATRSRST